jgi:hypothetical protein
MTIEQQNLIDSLRQQAASAYDKMDEKQVDYDKFKQVADASTLKADQAQKVYDRLYKTFIYYPAFIRSLSKIKDDARSISDEDQKILNDKYISFVDYKYEYENIISQINQNLLKIDAEELAYDIQDIVDSPDSLTYSYELVDAADEYARKKVQAEIAKDAITGREACLDKDGYEIDMSICRPSGGGGSGGGGGNGYVPSPADIIGRKVDDWINVISIAVKTNDINDVINVDKATSQSVERRAEAAAAEKAAQVKAEKAAAEKASEEKARLEKIDAEQKALIDAAEKAAAEKAAAEKAVSDKKLQELNAIVSQYSFNVDVSKITKDKELLEKTEPSPRQQNINYALCSSKKVIKVIERYVTIGDTINDWTYIHSGIIGTERSFATNVKSNNAIYLQVGNKVKIWKTDNIYIQGVVTKTYNPNTSGGVLTFKVTDVFGSGTFNGFSVQALYATEDTIKFVINNPYSKYSNGMEWSVYIDSVSANDNEIAIARAYCPTSDVSSEYYKDLDSNKIGFDGTEINKKNNLIPLYYILGGVSLFFIVKSILKKNK